MNRRNLLRFTALGTAAVALTGCATFKSMFSSPTSTITFTQQALSDVQNVLAGLNNLLGSLALVPTAIQAQAKVVAASVATYLGDAETALANVSVGSLVKPTTVSGVLSDLEAAAAAVAPLLAGNVYLAAVEALLPILAAAWKVVMPAGAAVGEMSADQARLVLNGLPRPVGVRGRS